MTFKVRAACLWLIILAAFLAADITAQNNSLKNLLLTTPKINAAGLNIKAAEILNEEKFMLTYEIVAEKTVKAVKANYPVTLVGTNYTYPYVMPYRMLAGAFFTEEAEEGSASHLVLNRTAAFDLFKSLDIVANEVIIDHKTYTVAGVIDDGDEINRRVYLPAAILQQNPSVFMSVLDEEKGLSEAVVKNEFKHLGITDSHYDFINLQLVSELIHDKFLLVLKITAGAWLLLVLRKIRIRLKAQIDELKALSQQFYFRELIKNQPREAVRAVSLSLTVALVFSLLLKLSLSLLENLLKWRQYAELADKLRDGSFALNAGFLQDLSLYTDLGFGVFLIVIGIFFYAFRA